MSDTKTAGWIAALERARAELEGALPVAAPEGRPRTDADADWAGYEQALKGTPVYRCWMQLNEAIEELRRQAAQDGTAAATASRRVSLRDVLEHIRAEAAPSSAEPPAASGAAAGARPAAVAGFPPAQAEEATVSFVIRERARPTPAVAQDGEPPDAKAPEQAPSAPGPDRRPDHGDEAEVVIVRPRR